VKMLRQASNLSVTSNTGSDRNGSDIFVDNEIDLIHDEDLIDASASVSLDDGNNVQQMSDKVKKDKSSTRPTARGSTNEEISQDVMKNADELLERENDKVFWGKKKIIMTIVMIVTTILAIALAISLTTGRTKSIEERVDENIKEKSTAFDFNDRDAFAEQKVSDGILNKEIPLDDGTIFPIALENNFMDFDELPFNANYETPFFWKIPTSGAIIQSIMTACLRKVLASDDIHWKNEDMLDVLVINNHPYVNVDLSMPEGIKDAAVKGLVPSGFADVVSSSHLQFSASELFDTEHKGRMFTVFRHPVDRTIATYHFVITKTNDPVVSNMTLTEFVSSSEMDKDWFTRFLVNKRHEGLNIDDLQLAKEIIRRKCVVGIHEDIDTSMKHFDNYFGWKTNGKAYDMCSKAIIAKERSRARDTYARIGMIKEGDPVYETIVRLNNFDMQLYWYAYDLFEEQKKWLKLNRKRLSNSS